MKFLYFLRFYVSNQSFRICLENYHNCCGRRSIVVVGRHLVVATESIYRNLPCMCVRSSVWHNVCVYVCMSLSQRLWGVWYIFRICDCSAHNCERLFFISTPFASKTVYSLCKSHYNFNFNFQHVFSHNEFFISSFILCLSSTSAWQWRKTNSNDMICKWKIRI